MNVFIEKGMRVRAQVLSVNPNTCLAGMQMKVGMTARGVIGVCPKCSKRAAAERYPLPDNV
jgi:hypothetical protein